MSNIGTFIGSVIGAAGGTALIMWLVIKNAGKWFLDALMEEYKLSISKELEQFKAITGSAQHVTEKVFDTEHEMYRDLVHRTNEIVALIEDVIPVSGELQYPVEPRERDQFLNDKLQQIQEKYKAAVIASREYHPFISESISVEKLYNEIESQIQVIRRVAEEGRVERISQVDFDRTKRMLKQYKEITDEVGAQLQMLTLKA